MKALSLNKAGRGRFERVVERLRAGETVTNPQSVLEDGTFVEELPFELEVREGGFASRFEMGQHLVTALADVDKTTFIGERGFWDWLALRWFDDFCPVLRDGSRKKPRETASYLMSEDYNRRYRHAVYVTWQLVDIHGENARPLLFKEPSVRGELTEQLMARQLYLSCRGVIEGVRKLYWDDSAARLKKGAAGKSSGSARRLASWLQQLEVTYDLFTMTGDQLIDLIPREFQKFVP